MNKKQRIICLHQIISKASSIALELEIYADSFDGPVKEHRMADVQSLRRVILRLGWFEVEMRKELEANEANEANA